MKLPEEIENFPRKSIFFNRDPWPPRFQTRLTPLTEGNRSKTNCTARERVC